MRVILHATGNTPVGLAVARSLGKKNIDIAVISEKKDSIVPCSKYCHEEIESVSDQNLFAGLSEQDIVFPTLDEEIMLNLAKNASNLRCVLGFPDYTVLDTVIYKNRMTKHAIDQGISCPETIFIEKAADLDTIDIPINFPVIVKPSCGSGGKGVTVAGDMATLDAAARDLLANRGPFMIQEKIRFDHKCTVGVLCNHESEIKRICILKELRNYPVETGPACCVESIYRRDLVNICKKLMKSLNYYGIADIDFLIDGNGKPWFMEINPRFWGSTQGAIAAGVDFPYLFYQMITEGDLDTSLTYQTGIRCRYLMFDDIMRLITVIGGRYSARYKMNAIADFLKFYQDDEYYIFSRDDLKPFFCMLSLKLSQYRSRMQLRKVIG